MSTTEKFSPKDETTIREEVTNEFKELGYDPELEENKPLLDTLIKKELDKETERATFHGQLEETNKKVEDTSKKLSQAINQKKKRDEIIESLKNTPNDDDPIDEIDNQPKPNEEKTAPETPKPQDNEDISFLKQKVATMEANQHRKEYSHLTDEEYNTVLTVAGNLDKFNETLESNPMIKNYLETNKVNERVKGATTPPSNRTGVSPNMSFEQIDLGNPDHRAWLKADPKRKKDYQAFIDRTGGLALTN